MNRLLQAKLNRMNRRNAVRFLKNAEALSPANKLVLATYPASPVVRGDPDVKPLGTDEVRKLNSLETEGNENGKS